MTCLLMRDRYGTRHAYTSQSIKHECSQRDGERIVSKTFSLAVSARLVLVNAPRGVLRGADQTGEISWKPAAARPGDRRTLSAETVHSGKRHSCEGLSRKRPSGAGCVSHRVGGLPILPTGAVL